MNAGLGCQTLAFQTLALSNLGFRGLGRLDFWKSLTKLVRRYPRKAVAAL
jgi:hypothetical protein